MNLILIFSILIFSFLISKINQKNNSIANIIITSSTLIPVIIFNKTTFSIIIAFIIYIILLLITDFCRHQILKKILFLITIIYSFLSILYLQGIINFKFEIDSPKIFIVNDLSLETIKRFQQSALYLPNILRSTVYNSFQIIFMIFIRVLNYLWVDKIITYLGFSSIYLIYLSITKKKNLHYFLIPLFIILSAVLHRDPNNYLIYLFCIPPLILIFIKNINKLNPIFLLFLILVSCLYSFL